MTPCRPRRRADRGAGPVTVIMVLAILALVFTISVTAVFAVAGDERSGAMHAADAAALAGARGVLDQAPADVAPGFVTPAEIPTLLGGGVCVQTGRVDAFRLAAANDATLTSYCYNVFTDTVRVAVRMNDFNVGSGPATASAEAATSFQAASCVLDPDFEPPTAPSPSPPPPPPPGGPTPTPTPTPPPPPPPGPVETTIDCGFGDLRILFRPAVNRFFFLDLATELEDRDPRLTE
jgi:hypothetical protein